MKSDKPRSVQLAHVQNLPLSLAYGLRGGYATVILDVRPRKGFDADPSGLADAVPIYTDEMPVMLPDLDRDQPMLIYCQSEGQVLSKQVAEWLISLGYLYVWVMDGGLLAWDNSRRSRTVLDSEARVAIGKWIAAPVVKR